jgi:hypothetical protein
MACVVMSATWAHSPRITRPLVELAHGHPLGLSLLTEPPGLLRSIRVNEIDHQTAICRLARSSR